MADIYFSEDMKAYVYKWAEKEISDSAVNGTASSFSLNNTVSNVLGLGETPLPDTVNSTSGAIALRDVAVYYRKDGSDTKVGEFAISSISGTTVIFKASVTTTLADNIIVSYPYVEAGDKTTFTCSIKDYKKSGGESDSSQENTIGGCSYKKKLPASLVELEFTAIKNGISLSQAVNGEMIKTTAEVAGKTIKTTTQASKRTPRLIIVRGLDPVNTSVSLISVARNVDGVTADHSGGAEDSWEESITFKTNQKDYAEIEVQ
jgi:hypothetical protein